jgi:hypothetical protein
MRHVLLTCRNHPHLRWMCKEIAVNKDGSYNGARNIFYLGTSTPEHSGFDARFTEPECSCKPSELTFAPENEVIPS